MITSQKLLNMFNYWLGTPVNSIFGSSFGCDKASLFLQPLSAPVADAFIRKLKEDLPIFAQLNSGQMSIQVETQNFDVVMIYFRLGDVLIELGNPQVSQSTGDTFNVNAQ